MRLLSTLFLIVSAATAADWVSIQPDASLKGWTRLPIPPGAPLDVVTPVERQPQGWRSRLRRREGQRPRVAPLPSRAQELPFARRTETSAFECDRLSGDVGIEAEHYHIEFRNLKLQELP